MSKARKARPEKPRAEVEWDFNSFPTYFGVAAGAFFASVLIAVGLYNVVFIVSLFAVRAPRSTRSSRPAKPRLTETANRSPRGAPPRPT